MQPPIERARLRLLAAAIVLLASLLGSAVLLEQAGAQDDSPVGEWSVALARTDIPVDIASSFSYVGRWRLGIEADGTYEAERLDVGATVVTGTWTAKGNQITFTDQAGLLACSNAAAAPIVNDDLTTGAYFWSRTAKTLTLTRVDDACPGRIILLSTFAFKTFIACTTPAMSMPELLGTPAAAAEIGNGSSLPASPQPETLAATPNASGSPLPVAVAGLDGSPVPIASPDAHLDFAGEIDAVLDQLTACWASREPERWLPLLSNGFRQALIESDPNFLETLTISMSAPVAWERSGDITIEAPNRISTMVQSTSGTQQDFQRFVFVFEDGQWRWDG